MKKFLGRRTLQQPEKEKKKRKKKKKRSRLGRRHVLGKRGRSCSGGGRKIGDIEEKGI